MIKVSDPGISVEKVLINPSVCLFAVNMSIKLLYLYQSREMSTIGIRGYVGNVCALLPPELGKNFEGASFFIWSCDTFAEP